VSDNRQVCSSKAEISYVAALHAKLPVTLCDPSQIVLSAGTKRFTSWLDKDVAKGRLSQADANEARDRLSVINGDGTQGNTIEADTSLVVEVRIARLRALTTRQYLRYLT
jgi:3-hydroxybutyryl-CoA dehydrogenase